MKYPSIHASIHAGDKIWNALPDEMKYEKSMRAFKRKLEALNLSTLNLYDFLNLYIDVKLYIYFKT